MLLSIIVPVYNEQDSLAELVARIDAVAKAQGYTIDVWFIDDGSRDESWQRVTQLAQAYPYVHGLKLRRNLAKRCVIGGFRSRARSRLITMDADLQDDPNEIPACSPNSMKASMSSPAGSKFGTIPGIRLDRAAFLIG